MAKQKLVTIFLHDKFDPKKGNYGNPESGDFFGIREHLAAYLNEG